MSDFETVKYIKNDDVAEVVLNRPKVLNAYNIKMRDEIYQVFSAVQEDPDVACIVLRGEGDRAFCSGADLTEFGSSPSRVIARDVRWERDVWGLLLSIEKPIIAALHGYVIGSGLEMALLCDLRLAAQDSIFILPEAGLGMLPAAGGSQTLPRTIGIPRANEMLLSGNQFDVYGALDFGLVHKVVSGDTIVDVAMTLASELARYPRGPMVAIKKAIRRGIELPLEPALNMELRIAVGSMAIDS
jgi:enoyl-CoA hydratase/carnithine racemase